MTEYVGAMSRPEMVIDDGWLKLVSVSQGAGESRAAHQSLGAYLRYLTYLAVSPIGAQGPNKEHPQYPLGACHHQVLIIPIVVSASARRNDISISSKLPISARRRTWTYQFLPFFLQLRPSTSCLSSSPSDTAINGRCEKQTKNAKNGIQLPLIIADHHITSALGPSPMMP